MTAQAKLELIQHLDFDPEIACESKWSKGEEAAWLVIMTCCGNNRMLCDGHKVKTQKFRDSGFEEGRIVFCLNCRRPQNEDTMQFRPLDKRR